MNKGKLIVISGPSGAGKSSLIKKLIRENKHKLNFSVSYTSRKQREGEIDGIDYFFISAEEFKKGIDNDIFLEWACVHENYYGTSIEIIENILKDGKVCILDIDVQGAINLMDKKIDAIYLFVAPPSIESLRKRLLGRGTDVIATIDLRVKNAEHELTFKNRYKYVIVNDDFDRAYKELESIIFKYDNGGKN